MILTPPFSVFIFFNIKNREKVGVKTWICPRAFFEGKTGHMPLKFK